MLEELEIAAAKSEAEEEKKDESLKPKRAKKRRANRGSLPAHLPRIEQVIEPESRSCCGLPMRVIGEDRSERLDKIPATLRVIVTRRPKYGCECEEAIVQAPAPARLVEGGIPQRRSSRMSWSPDTLTICHYTGRRKSSPARRSSSTARRWRHGLALRRPNWSRSMTGCVPILKGMGKLFADETRCPVLDPGRGKTKQGYFWALACDDRPWGSHRRPP